MTESRVVKYGISGEADIRAKDIKASVLESHFTVRASGQSMKIQTKLIGMHNVYNILAAVGVCLNEGIAPETISRGIARLEHVPGRLERIESPKGFAVFIDYAHTEDALKNVLEALRNIKPKRIITVFGCGGDRDKTKRPKMGRVAGHLSDVVIVTNDNPRGEDPQSIISGIILGFSTDNYQVVADRERAIATAIAMAGAGDIVLVAGKGHEDYQIFKDKTIAFNERKIVEKYLKCLTLAQVLEATGGTLIYGRRAPGRFTGVSIDSRTLKRGNVFVAVRGKNLDGHRFIAPAVRKGASLLVVSEKISGAKDVPVVLVKDTTAALGQIAGAYRKSFDIPVIAVTGSAGKTTTKDMIAAVLGSKFKVLKNEKTLNNQYGVSLTVLGLRPADEALVIELGTNNPGEIEWLAAIAQPTIAVLTNIGESHLAGLKNRMGVYKEKSAIFRGIGAKGYVIFNNDDPYLRRISGEKNTRGSLPAELNANLICKPGRSR